MGTITVNVDDETEIIFRDKVSQLYGKKKGTLGRALGEALTEWSRKKECFDVCMKLLKEGAVRGYMPYKNRVELHERGR